MTTIDEFPFPTCEHCGFPTLRGTGIIPLVLCHCGRVLCASCLPCKAKGE